MYIGIVAEWNPFHEGHQFLLSSVKALTGGAPVACAMSGAFVQRGEPALFDPWSRARWALAGGVSIAAELPALCVLQSADRFAAAGARLLAGMGCTHMAFGTESLGRDALLSIASWTLSARFTASLRQQLKSGASYARAVHTAITARFPQWEADLTRPNNLLGMQYTRTILAESLPMEILPIHRDTGRPISATAIRASISAGRPPAFIPAGEKKEMDALLAKGAYTDYRRYEDACLLAARSREISELSASGLFSEGLEHRWHACSRAASYEAMLGAIKNKRYLYSRLRRIGAALLLSGSESPSPFARAPAAPYIRLLALRKEDSALLRQASLPVVTSFARAERSAPENFRPFLRMERRATDIQAWCLHSAEARAGRADYFQSPSVLSFL